jgi:hypothetical protein
MSYYQVLIAIESSPEQLLNLFVDLTEIELQEKFLKPYRKGLNIFTGNTIYPASQIKKIHIINTSEANGVIRDRIHKKSLETIRRINESGSVVFLSPGNGYEPEDILEAGEDMTDKYLSDTFDLESPKIFSGFLKFINNQWVVGVVLLLIAAYFGIG